MRAKDQLVSGSESILIILTGALGDVARALPLIDQLRRTHPKIKIAWLIEDKWRAILDLVRGIDEIIVFERARGIAGVLNLRKQLAQRKFDITLDLQRHFKSGIFSLFSRAPRRIGFHRQNSKELNWVFNTETIDFVSNAVPKILHYLEFIKALGIQPHSNLEFGVRRDDLNLLLPKVITEISDQFVAIVLGSSWESKDWTAKGYLGLAQELIELDGSRVILIGDRTKVELAGRIEQQINSTKLINLVAKTTLPELVAVLNQAAVVVGPDSGPGHISAALGTPYVTLFGPTLPSRVVPYRNEALVIKSDIGCSPCWQRRCPGLGGLCMKLITVAEVRAKIGMALMQRSTTKSAGALTS